MNNPSDLLVKASNEWLTIAANRLLISEKIIARGKLRHASLPTVKTTKVIPRKNIVRIQLTGVGSVWRVGRIEITTALQHQSLQVNLPASSYDAAVQLAMRHGIGLVQSVGCRKEDIEWDIHPRLPEPSKRQVRH